MHGGSALARFASSRAAWTIPAEVGEPDDPPHVLYVGRLSEEKGIPELLEATEGLPRVIVGDGPLRDRVPDAVGFVAPSELGAYYERAAVVVCPSRREGYGVVAREAMAYGRPVVASAVGGLLDAVEDGVTGLLVAPRRSGRLCGRRSTACSATPRSGSGSAPTHDSVHASASRGTRRPRRSWSRIAPRSARTFSTCRRRLAACRDGAPTRTAARALTLTSRRARRPSGLVPRSTTTRPTRRGQARPRRSRLRSGGCSCAAPRRERRSLQRRRREPARAG